MNGVECIRKEDKQDTSHRAIHKFHSVWKPQMERKLICVITRLRSKLRSLEGVFGTVFFLCVFDTSNTCRPIQ